LYYQNMKKYIKTLTIAGSDSGGGAGIQADLKTFSALGCYGMSVITVLTAQNTLGVQAIQDIPAEFIGKQLDSIFSDMGVDAIKIGMLHSPAVIEIIAAHLKNHSAIPIVLDPVMIAKDGSPLLQQNAVDALRIQLFPLATLITPNLTEVEVLLQQTIRDHQAMEQAAQQLCTLGPQAVLIKGGHLENAESADCLYIKNQNRCHWFTNQRIATHNTHGTGCTLSAAITAFMAKGNNLLAAVSAAKQYISAAIAAGSAYTLGKGHGPVQHFHQWWD
jgi:hydroxymethylpyrimidine/phosphomethylpyrimidine kinase